MRIGITGGGGDELDIETRSILSTMFNLDQGIKVPARSGSGEMVNVSLANNAQTFDSGKFTMASLNCGLRSKKPTDPYTSVRYGGYWYYIDNWDEESKETLTMLSIVLTLKRVVRQRKGHCRHSRSRAPG